MGEGPFILVYIHTHMHDRLDKLRSALAEAQLKMMLKELYKHTKIETLMPD